MKLCFPVEEFKGPGSNVFGHFGSAPCFALYDTETHEIVKLDNKDAVHDHGKCSPLKAIGNIDVDCVIAGGIGAGALNRLISMGISVYRAEKVTVEENVTMFLENSLNRFNPTLVCRGHGKGSACSHH